jgi:hypothetical protein
MTHDQTCPKRNGRYVRQDCRDYSTEEIKAKAFTDREEETLTGMDEEQADWEAGDDVD